MSDDARRIVVLSWFDVFTFDLAPTITCPDCDVMSPVLPDLWKAVKWAEDHQRSCEA